MVSPTFLSSLWNAKRKPQGWLKTTSVYLFAFPFCFDTFRFASHERLYRGSIQYQAYFATPSWQRVALNIQFYNLLTFTLDANGDSDNALLQVLPSGR